MKTVTVTMKFVFETEEADDETLKEALTQAFEERVENDELLESGTKIKVVEQEIDEEEDPDFEDDED